MAGLIARDETRHMRFPSHLGMVSRLFCVKLCLVSLIAVLSCSYASAQDERSVSAKDNLAINIKAIELEAGKQNADPVRAADLKKLLDAADQLKTLADNGMFKNDIELFEREVARIKARMQGLGLKVYDLTP